MVDKKAEVHDLAKRFRVFLEGTEPRFPKCQLASGVFERVLWEHASIRSVLVNCESATLAIEDQPEDFLRHDWLHVGDVFVDLTIDQFSDRAEAWPVPPGVIFPVGSPWHAQHFPEAKRQYFQGEWGRWAHDSRALEIYREFMHELGHRP